MSKQIVQTQAAPEAIGPYSQAVRFGGLVFTSGQIALDPESGTLQGATIQEQTRRAIRNLKAIVTAAGLAPDALVKTTVFLRSMADFGAFNAVYEEELGGAAPARSQRRADT